MRSGRSLISSRLLRLRWEDLDLGRGNLTVVKTMRRVGRRLHVDDTKSEASGATVPLPKITRRELLAHRDRRDKERIDAAGV
jgi:hypothetical protein